MSELVKILSGASHPILVNRKNPVANALKERIGLGYVHVFFEVTGTEIGIKLNIEQCNFSRASFENATGLIHLEGYVTLDYEKVCCVADIDLGSLRGTALLIPVGTDEYNRQTGITA